MPFYAARSFQYVAESIRQFGWKQPLVIDADGVIIVGHTRYKAAQSLGLDRVPCLVADDLTPQQIKAYRLADNKVSELSEWVNDDLLHELDMLTTDFDLAALGFPTLDMDEFMPDLDADEEEESEEDKRARYQAYLDSHPGEPPKELITTQASIDTAAVKQQNVPEKPKKYFKVICEKCGHVMFVAEGDAHLLTS